MAECRFHGECRLIGGLTPRQCDGKGFITTLSAVGYVYGKCPRFEPIPDAGALLKLAGEMGERRRWCCGADAVHAKACSNRIKKACGQAKG